MLSSVAMYAQVNAEQVIIIGRNVLSMQDYMLAIQYFNQAIKAKPYLSDPYFFRGLAKLSLDDYVGAEADCSLSIERNRFKVEAYKVRGFARQQLGRDSLAIADYDVGLKHNPIDRYFLFYKGVAQSNLKHYEAADSTFSLLLRQYPNFDEGYAARGRLNTLRGDTVAALSDIEKSLSISKAQVNPYLMRADIFAGRHEWEAALKDMDEAVRLIPEEPDLYINRAFLRYNNNDYFGAMSDYNYALDLSPNNIQARFNRALLEFEVRDMAKASADFSEVLRLDPNNFHALYNRALIYLDRGEWKNARRDLNAIASRYPKFYPVYYGLAECSKGIGDLRSAFAYMNKADDMVRRYVDNPERNPLDRPTIDGSSANVTSRRNKDDSLSDVEVMDKFNRLMTSADVNETPLSYNESIKGRVQDRNIQVEPEPMYALTFRIPSVNLRSLSNNFRDLDNLNERRFINRMLYLSPGNPSPSTEDEINEIFALAEKYGRVIADGNGRPVDFLARGVAYTMLKNYGDAVRDFTEALREIPDFTVALMGRAYCRYMEAVNEDDEIKRNAGIREAVADYDEALKYNPTLVFAWFNKGNIYYGSGDFTSAIQCYSKAVEADSSFGQAFFNRGLSYLSAGNRNQGFADLSKAGELGIIPSYSLLKRMK